MKKLMTRIALGAGTLGVIVAGAAAFSAFEAHVINVTARIENALQVDTTPIDFGTVFPQEQLDETFDVFLSRSFLEEDRVDDVNYEIRQKPKCGLPIQQTDPVQYSGFVQVEEDGQGNFVCPEVEVDEGIFVQSEPLPLLCPYLSKHEVTQDDDPATGGENDQDINAFHGLPGPWTLATTLANVATGRLSKFAQDTLDTWNIDLKVPCFAGYCAQDWDEFVIEESGNPQIDPDDYVANPQLQHEIFGCDLWLEVNGVSRTAKLTVDKIVVDPDGQGSLDEGDFSLFIDGNGATDEVPVIVTAGAHVVSETIDPNYVSVIGGACLPDGSVTLAEGDDKTCTITNTFNE